jgi:NADPH-dependent 2,4-dienoyl-CoA reductase/sulfur reductase-like enzyme/rhodanese-related sulfurtransferase
MASVNRIVIIGGNACGPKAAARARRCDPHARITIVEQDDYVSTATCGFPYYVSGVIAQKKSLFGRELDYFTNVFGVDVLTGTRAVAIDRRAHQVEIVNLKTNEKASLPYDKLVLATGSLPAVPNLPGKELNGIFTMTRIGDALALRDLLANYERKQAVVVGAGLIGLEMAEALKVLGFEVTVIEALNWALPTLLDVEIAAQVEKHLRDKGVKVIFGQRVAGFEGDENNKVKRVITKDGGFEAGLVLMALGVKPNVTPAREAGITIGKTGGIAVNEYLQTSDKDIYAGGDCVENVHLITKQKVLVPLGSTANKHGRVIGTNVTGGRETFPGVAGTVAIKVFDFNVARTGLSETQAREAGYEVVTSLVPNYDHATYYPGYKEITVKLIAEKKTGRLLGGQAVGPGDTAKRIDVVATAISFGTSVDDLANTDLAYAPPYNSALDPLHSAANVIRNKRAGLAKSLTPMEVKAKLDGGDDFILLDVRTKKEWEEKRIEAPQVKFLPVQELRARLDELPKDAEIVVFCRSSVRAYQSQRILEGAGFKKVKFMDGSIAGWPYGVGGAKPS